MRPDVCLGTTSAEAKPARFPVLFWNAVFLVTHCFKTRSWNLLSKIGKLKLPQMARIFAFKIIWTNALSLATFLPRERWGLSVLGQGSRTCFTVDGQEMRQARTGVSDSFLSRPCCLLTSYQSYHVLLHFALLRFSDTAFFFFKQI